MSRRKVTLSLSRADLDQLRWYEHNTLREGTYYGNKEQFEKRRDHITKELFNALGPFELAEFHANQRREQKELDRELVNDLLTSAVKK